MYSNIPYLMEESSDFGLKPNKPTFFVHENNQCIVIGEWMAVNSGFTGPQNAPELLEPINFFWRKKKITEKHLDSPHKSNTSFSTYSLHFPSNLL